MGMFFDLFLFSPGSQRTGIYSNSLKKGKKQDLTPKSFDI